MKHPTLYKISSTGKVQEWWMQADIDRYRTLHCVQGGKVVASEWTYPTPKNIGRANETTAEEQAKLEIESIYKKKLAQGKYTDDPSKLVEAKESYFSPMLANKFDADRLGTHFYIQPKFNGVRCIATKDGLFSRKGKEFVNTPHINAALEKFFKENPDAILDGELYNHNFKDDFNNLVSAIRKTKPTTKTQTDAAKVVQYYLYDIAGSDMVGSIGSKNFGARYAILDYTYSDYFYGDWAIELSPTIRSSDIKTADGLHKRNKAAGYEGSIIRADTPYENKRTYALMKYKDFQDAEFEILDIEEGKGNWSGVAKKVKLKLPAGVTSAAGNPYFHAGVKGDKAFCDKLLKDKKDLIGKMATIVFFELTPDKVPLFPIFHSVRDYE